jgi:hypothetical protein
MKKHTRFPTVLLSGELARDMNLTNIRDMEMEK